MESQEEPRILIKRQVRTAKIRSILFSTCIILIPLLIFEREIFCSVLGCAMAMIPVGWVYMLTLYFGFGRKVAKHIREEWSEESSNHYPGFQQTTSHFPSSSTIVSCNQTFIDGINAANGNSVGANYIMPIKHNH